jgi:hypothetical protein
MRDPVAQGLLQRFNRLIAAPLAAPGMPIAMVE